MALYDGSISQALESNGGFVRNVDTSPGGANALRLIVVDGLAIFYVNDEHVANFQVARSQRAGSILLAVGSVHGYEIKDQVTEFEDFTVWSLD
jgi:hypothetical protein